MGKCMTDPRHGGVHGPRNISSELRDCGIDVGRGGGAEGVCFSLYTTSGPGKSEGKTRSWTGDKKFNTRIRYKKEKESGVGWKFNKAS